MKILVVVHQFLPEHRAGSEYYTFYLSRELARRGHEVVLYTTEMDHGARHAELRRREHEGLPVLEAVNNHQFPSLWDAWRDPEMEANLVRVLDEVRPDVVHVQHLYLHSLGYLDLLAARRIPVVYTLHEYLPLCLRAGQLLHASGGLCDGPDLDACTECARSLTFLPRLDPDGPDRPVEPEPDLRTAVHLRTEDVRRAFRKVDLFVAPSRFLRDRYVENGFVAPERIVHSDYGFDTSGYRAVPHRPADELRVGFFGTIGEWKGVHVLVEAFDHLPETGVSCKIFGDLAFLPEYVARLRERRRSLAVRFLGRFENARVPEVLSELDVLVVPSLWYENSPLTIHEAFLAGVPVLCSDRGGMAELVEHGVSGLHFRLGDARDLARQIQRLLKEPELLPKLRAGVPAVRTIEEDARAMEARFVRLLERD